MLLFIINASFLKNKRSVPFICSCHISLQSTAAGESGARGGLAAPRAESVFVVGTVRVTHPGTLASGRVSPTRSVLITNASTISPIYKYDVITILCLMFLITLIVNIV